MRRFQNFLYWCIEDPARDASKALLCITLLCCAFLALVGSWINYTLDFPLLMLVLNVVFCGIYFWMYLKVRFYRAPTQKYAVFFVYTTLCLLACCWPLNAGVIGPIPMFFLGLLMLSAFLVTPRTYLTFTLILITSFCGLTFFDLQSTQSLLPLYIDNHAWDMASSALVLLIALSVSLYGFRQRYTQEQQLLQSAAEYKSRFLAQMSHEMRTPLNAILGFSKYLNLHPELTEDKKTLYLNRVYENGLSLLAFFEDLLDISKIESGQLRLHPQDMDLQELLKQCYTRYEQQIHEKPLHYESQITGSTQITGDPHRLKQVIGNLLHNAIKFTPPEGHITVRVFQLQQQLCLEVKDTGPGISAADQILVFTPFYRSQHQAEGSGLGLAIVRELCDLMGYTLRLISTEGQGCTFQIWIPL